MNIKKEIDAQLFDILDCVKKNDEVYYTDADITVIDDQIISIFKRIADLNANKKVRLCLHKSDDEQVQEMLVLYAKGAMLVPHKQYNKQVSYIILEGRCKVILYEDDGKEKRVINLDCNTTNIIRLPTSIYRVMKMVTDYLVFVEINNGPFRHEETIWLGS